MKKNLTDIRYVSEEDLENMSSNELRTLGSSSIIVCVVKRNEKERNCIQPGQSSENDIQRIAGENALLPWNKSGTEKRRDHGYPN